MEFSFDPWRAMIAQWLAEAGQDHMSPVGMYLAADIVVKAVMISLAVASVLVWAVFVARLVLLAAARLRLRRNYRALEKAGTLNTVEARFAKRRGVMGAMVRAALDERRRSGDGPDAGIKERADSALSRIEVGAARSQQRGSALLAITGSTAPFVGLFGTVWGIMNSFISIAETNTTNLAVVAPGIAEALLATAIGLVAAIPAVIFYNLLARSVSGYKVMLGDASALVARTLSRDLDLSPRAMVQRAAPHAQAAE
ncbi:tonB-system energizer ExbB [Tropicibacter naphthalenivorans]|uniref:Biopolymer transport protein ExbB n=1 Tax=Tropicibacter naphthalenivorans TaxID=441103 RepID=A0A0P1GWC7_9RHOB|nr:tonB-system energizer ExbB [Tropicibacter naphthalenivorans]CUH81010.1 Biopolymer transport protein ExbB [Tropicibacter naphthalenivorans]SMC91968.1 outer membrane transport energization protein ExbB (TC 2.C.1.1.1) [Tropicibacter naphthalenivorans]